MEPCTVCLPTSEGDANLRTVAGAHAGQEVGIFPVYDESVPDNERVTFVVLDCPICDGTGFVLDGQAERIKRGERHRQARLAKELTLRKFCLEYRLDPCVVSNYERGKHMTFITPLDH